MSRDLWGLLLAILGLVIAWLWGSGKISKVWNDITGNFGTSSGPASAFGSIAGAAAVAKVSVPPLDAPTYNALAYSGPSPSNIPNYISGASNAAPYVGGQASG